MKDNRMILSGVPLNDEQGNRVTHVAGMEDELAKRATPEQLQRLQETGAIVGDWDTPPKADPVALESQVAELEEQLKNEQQAHVATSKAAGVRISNLEGQLQEVQGELSTANTNLKLATDEGVQTLRRAEQADGDLATAQATIEDLKAQLEAVHTKATPVKTTK